MEVIPAVDLMKGKVVRLTKGDPKALKEYKHLGDPISTAKTWESKGADALHLVDLDAALEMGNNLNIIKRIVKVVSIPVQVGGGIRTLKSAETLLEAGAERIVVGSLAFKEPTTLTKLIKAFSPKRIVVALDHHEGKVMIQGWRKATNLSVEEALKKFTKLGAKAFLITSITRDGTLAGPDYTTLTKACNHKDIHVIAAGGVSSLQDLANLRKLGVSGVVIGKALYEGFFTLEDAVKVAKGGEP